MTKTQEIHFPGIKGNLIVWYSEDENAEKTVHIYGDPDGLRSFGKLLFAIAELNQENIPDRNLPPGQGFHVYIDNKNQLVKESREVLLGRLDGKLTKDFDWFIPVVTKREKDGDDVVIRIEKS